MNVWTAIAPQVFAAAFFGILLVSCKSTGAPQAAEAKSPPTSPLEITVRRDLLEQIRVGPAAPAEVSATLTVAGRVEADETRLARVSVPVTGRIVELDVAEGQQVKRDQTLATIHSTELASAQSNFLKAHSQQQVAERAVNRARQLLEAGVIGEAEVQRRDADLYQAAAELSSSHVQLGVLGMSAEAIGKLETGRTINSITHILSPINGSVLERKATIGQVVQAAEAICVIADLSNVWLVADVPEQSAGSLEIGKRVRAEVPAFPGLTINGKLSFVSAIVNGETRTVRTRMDLPNSERKFKPAMLATISLMSAAERRLVVPASAVVRENNQDYVFVQLAPDKFILRRVTLGLEHREGRVVTEGLNTGERIVLDGAFHINNERKRLSLQQG